MVDEILNDLRKEEPNHKVSIRVGEFPDCIGDPSLLRQVFINLLSNAFKFSRHKDNPVIEVGGGRRNEEKFYFVRYNGAGFDMRYADRMFDVFQRLHSSDQFEGTGVGLSIVKRIVERHGGRIRAESEINKGAIIEFTLPD